ncbi:hypothetical protein T484DRAFT_1560737, partial [Baffinella frigidus]
PPPASPTPPPTDPTTTALNPSTSLHLHSPPPPPCACPSPRLIHSRISPSPQGRSLNPPPSTPHREPSAIDPGPSTLKPSTPQADSMRAVLTQVGTLPPASPHPQHSTFNPAPSTPHRAGTLDPHPWPLPRSAPRTPYPTPSTPHPQPYTANLQSSTLSAHPKPSTLDSSGHLRPPNYALPTNYPLPTTPSQLRPPNQLPPPNYPLPTTPS